MSDQGASGRPWIGIPTGYDAELGRYVQDRRYLDAVAQTGGCPVLIPVPGSAGQVACLAGRLDGILLPGSPSDISPARYGEEPGPALGRMFPERDETDFALLDVAESRALPVLGICHGMQTLNVWRGGSLVQDIPSEVNGNIRHQNPGRPSHRPVHRIRIRSGCVLEGIFGSEFDVNSFHHQAVREPGRGLEIVAHAADGVVEAIEGPRGRFFIGVQWHPEASFERSAQTRALFRSFIQAAAEASGRRPGPASDGID